MQQMASNVDRRGDACARRGASFLEEGGKLMDNGGFKKKYYRWRGIPPLNIGQTGAFGWTGGRLGAVGPENVSENPPKLLYRLDMVPERAANAL